MLPRYYKTLTLALIVSVLLSTVLAESDMPKFKKTLIYQNNFNSFTDLDDWTMEGPGKKFLSGGQMMLIPDAQQYVYRKWEDCNRKILNGKNEYYAAVREGLSQVNPDMIEKVSNSKGDIVGGHMVSWNKAFETGDDYMVEYDFTPLSPIGLGIIFFSAKGVEGEDVLSESLKERNGVFSQYVKSDIDCYHISYWANNAGVGKRGTCNLRKNTGFFCLANGDDPSVADLDYSKKEFNVRTHKIQLVKIANNIKFYVDGILSIDYTDNRYNDTFADEGVNILKNKKVDTGEVHGSGRIGIRQMVGLIGEYDNFKAYNIQIEK